MAKNITYKKECYITKVKPAFDKLSEFMENPRECLKALLSYDICEERHYGRRDTCEFIDQYKNTPESIFLIELAKELIVTYDALKNNQRLGYDVKIFPNDITYYIYRTLYDHVPCFSSSSKLCELTRYPAGSEIIVGDGNSRIDPNSVEGENWSGSWDNAIRILEGE